MLLYTHVVHNYDYNSEWFHLRNRRSTQKTSGTIGIMHKINTSCYNYWVDHDYLQLQYIYIQDLRPLTHQKYTPLDGHKTARKLICFEIEVKCIVCKYRNLKQFYTCLLIILNTAIVYVMYVIASYIPLQLVITWNRGTGTAEAEC